MFWRKLSRFSKQTLLVLFICVTVVLIVVAVHTYINAYEFIGDLSDLPIPITHFIRHLVNDVFLRLTGFAGLVGYSGLATLAVLFVIRDIAAPLVNRSCARLFRFGPHFLNKQKQAEQAMEKTFIMRSLPWLLVSAAGLAVVFARTASPSIYTIVAVVVGISCLMCVLLSRRSIIICEEMRVIKKSELPRYQGYSLLGLVIGVLFVVSAVLCVVMVLSFVADRSNSLFWGSFYHQWESRVDEIYRVYPNLFGQTREDLLANLSDYVTTVQSENYATVAAFLPANPFQFAVIGSIMFFAAMGLPSMFVASQHFYGIKKTVVFVAVPILIGLLFWALGVMVQLPQESVILACIAMVIGNFLLTFLFQRLLGRK